MPDHIFRNLWLQKLAIAAFLISLFWDGLWGGVPRADQLIYLHSINQFDSFWEILKSSPFWNRKYGVGDLVLFRPILYFQLGISYYFFGYNFFLWQVTNLSLHLVAVLGVHSLLASGRLRATFYPLLLSLLFGSSILGSELVFWHHLGGYILFSIFFIYTIYFVQKFFQTGQYRHYWLSVLFGVLAQFTYELGFVVNVMLSLLFFFRYFASKYTVPLQVALPQLRNIKLGLIFVIAAITYPLISFADLISRSSLASSSSITMIDLWASCSAATWYALGQLGFWLGGLLLPEGYKIAASDRANFVGSITHGIPFLLNCLTVLLLSILWTIETVNKNIAANNRKNFRVIIATCLLFLFSYSFIIALGRAVPRGIGYVIHNNLYYAYIANLIFVFILYSIMSNKTSLENEYKIDNTIYKKNIIISAASKICLVFIILFNANSVKTLGRQFRYEYSPARNETINAVKEWNSKHIGDSQAYYDINANCQGNTEIPWFHSGYIRKNSGWAPPLNLADILFPEKSFRLNKDILRGKEYLVSDIACTEIIPSSMHENFGAQGLAVAANPGWHAALPLTFPQSLIIDMKRQRSVRHLEFLAQSGHPDRAPKTLQIAASNNASRWHDVFDGDLTCSDNSDHWNSITLKGAVDIRFLKIVITSNCGDSALLTLRGIRME
ncbi:MAG: discoidin domain-containing protein [Rhizobiaceae bacterium]|nr:discoidin domain-containing protein [Rhizobiaceae bacterium]